MAVNLQHANMNTQGTGSYADLVNGADLLSSVPATGWAVLLTFAL